MGQGKGETISWFYPHLAHNSIYLEVLVDMAKNDHKEVQDVQLEDEKHTLSRRDFLKTSTGIDHRNWGACTARFGFC